MVADRTPIELFRALTRLCSASLQVEAVKKQIMIPCNHDFVLVWLRIEPVYLRLELFQSASLGQVARMNKQITWRNRWLKVVGV